MSKLYLKIKIKSLAEEAKIIKKEELKQRAFKRYSLGKQGLMKAHDEAAKIFFGLKDHRINVVRFECRAAHLAYAFLRGQRYSDIENNTRANLFVAQPNGHFNMNNPEQNLWKRVARLIYKYNTDLQLDSYCEKKTDGRLGSPMLKPETLQDWVFDKYVSNTKIN